MTERDSAVPDSELIDPEYWCPDCQSPPKSDRASLVYCHMHTQATHGNADAEASFPVIPTWDAEAGGAHNVRMCEFVHRHKEQP